MSLNYGFNRFSSLPHDPELDTRYKAFTEIDKSFFHNSLPWILMMVDVGEVTTELIPHIDGRLKAYDIDMYRDTLKQIETTDLAQYLSKFVGFSANVCTIPSSEFIAKITKKLKRDIPPLTAATLRKR